MSEPTTTRDAAEEVVLPAFEVVFEEQAESGPVWRVRGASAAQKETAPRVAHPEMELCQAVQHAVGFAGFGSRILGERGAVGVYPTYNMISGPMIVLDGSALLAFAAQAAPATLKQFFHAVLQQIEAAAAGQAAPPAPALPELTPRPQ